MSKSKKNVIDPNILLDKYGADTTRLFCLFAAPPERDLEWSEQGVEGGFRFLNRVWRFATGNMHNIQNVAPYSGSPDQLDTESRRLYKKTHATIKRVTRDIEDRFHFNTAISAVMELMNTMYSVKVDEDVPQRNDVVRFAMEITALLLSPIVPHICDELWEILGHSTSHIETHWPDFSEAAIQEDEILVVVQINGKVRSRFHVAADVGEEEIKEAALSDDRVLARLAERPMKKVIVVKRKLVSIVV